MSIINAKLKFGFDFIWFFLSFDPIYSVQFENRKEFQRLIRNVQFELHLLLTALQHKFKILKKDQQILTFISARYWKMSKKKISHSIWLRQKIPPTLRWKLHLGVCVCECCTNLRRDHVTQVVYTCTLSQQMVIILFLYIYIA